MNPKWKSKELIEKFTHECEYNCQPSTVKGIAIKCALICVDEVLKSILFYDSQKEFWQSVKQELIKLK